jgi:pimeloyl-ACP methyl ester carboxylesterase
MNPRMYTKLLLLVLVLCASVPAQARSPTSGREIGLVGSWPVVVYTYQPEGCAEAKLLILFAGYDRDADKYRDRAIPLADRACLLLFAPLLDRERFPNWRYQRAGVYRDDHVQPESAWTQSVLRDLIAWARRWAGRSDIPTILFGHSAGAQFLSRAAAYFPPEDVYRIVIANPSVHVMPSLEEAAPYGFDGIFERDQRAERLRAYLRQRITIFLGQEDTKSGRLLVDDEGARRQGDNRYERGKELFATGRAVARQSGWPFNWRLVEVPGVGHSSRDLLNSPQALDALGLETPAPAQ